MITKIKFTIFAIILGAVVLGSAAYLGRDEGEEAVVTNFEECAAMGNPIAQSYPRTCRHMGMVFTEEVFVTYTHESGPINYSIEVPFGWYAHRNGPSVIFTQERELEIPYATDGFISGPNFYITVSNITDIDGVEGYEDWLDKNGMSEKSELFIERNPARIGNLEMLRVRSEMATAYGEVVNYVYFADTQRVVTLTQFPYELGSDISKIFENAVKTFRVPERQGGEGILPFKSGVYGKITLGPICPVVKDPPEPGCADKPYATSVQVIALDTPRSAPFAVVESDKDGSYKVMLPPGKYNVQAVGGAPFPACRAESVTIEPDKMLEMNLGCDTGIR